MEQSEPASLQQLYEKMKDCKACKVRSGCFQVVGGAGQMERPKLLIIGEAPSKDDDNTGEPLSGGEGECLRDALRTTKILNKMNTLYTNVLKCAPTDKFPKGDPAMICTMLWLSKEIELAQPKRMILLGNTPLKYVAGMEKVTTCRGNWYDVKGIRTMVTYHPRFVMREDARGDMHARQCFEQDIMEVAKEVAELEKAAFA